MIDYYTATKIMKSFYTVSFIVGLLFRSSDVYARAYVKSLMSSTKMPHIYRNTVTVIVCEDKHQAWET